MLQTVRPPRRTVLFWGEEHPEWRGLSNFIGGPLEIAHPFAGSPAEYRTVEHYYQASKAQTSDAHEHVRCSLTPKEAKRRGRKIALRADWDSVKVEVMKTALQAKFALPYYRDLLLTTGTRAIAEDSPHDFEWGIRDREGGYAGMNRLGRLLVDVREELRDSP